MATRVVIAGCRNDNNYQEASQYISLCLKDLVDENEIIIVSGGARGADKLGERYAKERGLKIEYYLPDWDKFGRAAGPIRNEQMAKVGDIVICFWDGVSRGTKTMIDYANKYNKLLRIKEIH